MRHLASPRLLAIPGVSPSMRQTTTPIAITVSKYTDLKDGQKPKSSFDKIFKNCVSGIEMPQTPNTFFLIHFTRSAERKVVPPRVRGPLPPLLWVSGWNNPLCNFLCSTATSTVTFHPNTFTCRTSVWNRGSWNLPLSIPSSCLPQSIPDYRHYYA